MSEESFRERYERLTDDELWRVVEVRNDLVPEAALELNREVERRQLKRPATPLLTSDPYFFGIIVALIVIPFLIWLSASRRSEFVYPVMVTSGAVASVVWVSWDLKRHLWFWSTIGIFVFLHVVLILVVPWRSGWVAAPVTGFACIVDLGIMLGSIRFLEKLNNKELKEKSSA